MIPITWPFVVWGLDLVGPFKKVPGAVVEPVGGPTFELLGLDKALELFRLRIPLTYDGLWPVQGGKMSGAFSEGMTVAEPPKL